MNDKYIRPFIESVRLVFSTMVHSDVTIGQPFIRGNIARDEVSSIIEFSGEISGRIILTCPIATAQVIVERLGGVRLEADDPDFSDAMGELVNLVAGAAKSKFEGVRVTMSTPTVRLGPDQPTDAKGSPVCIGLPCTTDCGTFCVDIAIREEPKGSRVAV